MDSLNGCQAIVLGVLGQNGVWLAFLDAHRHSQPKEGIDFIGCFRGEFETAINSNEVVTGKREPYYVVCVESDLLFSLPLPWVRSLSFRTSVGTAHSKN